MKKFIAISAIALVMTSCGSTGATATPTASAVATATTSTFLQDIVQKHNDLIRQAILQKSTTAMNKVLTRVKNQTGKTAYVFSGSTPAGWDCSGLVYWAYQQLGLEIPHSANKQGHLTNGVKVPKPGDIVVWAYKGSSSYYHAGLYIGNGNIIHAGFRKGSRTEILSLDDPSFKGSTAKFVRLIKTL